MNMINEYYEWCRSIEPEWVGFVVWFTALSVVVAATAIAAAWLLWEAVDRIGLWIMLCVPAFIAYCFYIAVLAQ